MARNKTTEPKPRLAIELVTTERMDNYDGRKRLDIKCLVRQEREDSNHSLTWGYPGYGEALKDLEVTAYLTEDNWQGGLDSTSWTRVAYECSYDTLELEQVEEMAKTLRKVKTHNDKLTQKYGETSNFSTFVLRVADALGIDAFLVKSRWSGDEPYATDAKDFDFQLRGLIYRWNYNNSPDGKEAARRREEERVVAETEAATTAA